VCLSSLSLSRRCDDARREAHKKRLTPRALHTQKKKNREQKKKKKKSDVCSLSFFDAAAAAFIPFLRFWLLFRIKKTKETYFIVDERARVCTFSRRHY
jgi:hypothetical protein